jgi:hypothetical protein
MKLSCLLFGEVSTGKTSLINTMAVTTELQTDKNATPIEGGYKDYVFSKERKTLHPRLPYDKLHVRDTDGYLFDEKNHGVDDILRGFVECDTYDMTYDKIVIFMIDAYRPWNNTYITVLQNIKKEIAKYRFVEMYIVFNKVNMVKQDILEIDVSRVSGISDNIIKMSCHQLFLDLIKNYKIDVPMGTYEYEDIRLMIKRTYGYKATNNLKNNCREAKIIYSALLFKKPEEDQKQYDYGISLFESLEVNHTKMVNVKTEYLVDMLKENLVDHFYNETIEDMVEMIIKLNKNSYQILEHMFTDITSSKIQLTDNKTNIEPFIKLQEKFKLHFMSSIIRRYSNALDFETLFESFIYDLDTYNAYNANLCVLVINNKQIYNRQYYNRIITKNIPTYVKYYLYLFNMSVNDIATCIELDLLDYKTIDEMRPNSKFYLNYICNHTLDKTKKLYECSVDNNSVEYKRFERIYTSLQKFKETKQFDVFENKDCKELPLSCRSSDIEDTDIDDACDIKTSGNGNDIGIVYDSAIFNNERSPVINNLTNCTVRIRNIHDNDSKQLLS